MTNVLTYLACIITGNDYSQLLRESGWSRKKVNILAMVVLLPTIIWAFSAYLLVHLVNGGSLKWSVVASAIAAFIIFLLERSIVMSEANTAFSRRAIGSLRWVLGGIIAVLGAFAVDNVVFDQEIRLQLDRMRQEEVRVARQSKEEEMTHELRIMAQKVEQARTSWQNALDEARREAEGSGGSGLRGVHSITMLKLRIAEQMENDYQSAIDAYNAAKEELKLRQMRSEEAALARFDQAGLLMRIEALHQLVKQNNSVLIVYLTFFLLMFLIEILPVTLKMTLHESSLDYRQRLLDEVHRRRLQTTFESPFPNESHASDPNFKRNGNPMITQKARFS